MNTSETIVCEMHRQYLEALRNREQNILQYIAILFGSIAGFAWLVESGKTGTGPGRSTEAIMVGTLGIQLILMIGAIYCVALGYSYRSILFETARLDRMLGVTPFIVRGWPRRVREFRKFTHWCGPPEVIKVFWIAFLLAIAGVTAIYAQFFCHDRATVSSVGVLCILTGFFCPILYARRFGKMFWSRQGFAGRKVRCHLWLRLHPPKQKLCVIKKQE